MAKHGVIYVLNNKIRDGENVFKVGETYDPDRRLADLNNETSNIGEFKKVAMFPVSDTVRAEKECFKELARFRIQDNREFFKGSQSEIISIVKNVASKYKPVEEIPAEEGVIFIWTDYCGEKGVLDVFSWEHLGWDPVWNTEGPDGWEGDDPDNMTCEQFAKFYISDLSGAMLQCEKELEPYWTDDYKPYKPRKPGLRIPMLAGKNLSEFKIFASLFKSYPTRIRVKQSYQNEIIKVVVKVASNYAIENEPPDLKHKFLIDEFYRD